jgi:twinkle protein
MSHGLIEPGNFQAIQKRGLSEETCRKWGYSVGHYNGQSVHIATYRNTAGEAIAQKVRFPNKEFVFLGDTRNSGLYGQHLWRDQGKRVVVTEGELDALSVSQVQDNKWACVSVPNGAQGAKKSIQRALEWLEGFEEVVFLFDNDEHGISAAKECALLLTPGKAKIGKLPLKDANDMLVAGRAKELIDATWSAKVFRPDGIINGSELWTALTEKSNVQCVPYPWSGLNTRTRGLRQGELVTFTAGSGIGKSQVCREIAHDLLKRGETVGYIALEESTKRTAEGLLGIELNKPIHLAEELSDEKALRQAFDRTVGSGRLFLFDHFGSLDSANLLSRIRYLTRGCGCGWIILDHLSIVVSGIGDGDERRLIDNTMTSLRSLVQETGVGMILVSHLKRPEGGNKGHEEGAQVSLAQLRGSAAIAQLSDIVIGLERDQQDEDTKHLTTVRVLKNRFSGETGVATTLAYDPTTGRLHEGTVTPSQMMAASKDF